MKLLPGLILVAAIGAASTALNNLYPPVSAVLVALILGFMLKQILKSRQDFQPGAQYAVKSLLKLAIIFLGVRLSFQEFANLGVRTPAIITICIILALMLIYFMAKKAKIPPKLGALIAVGTAICGNSAVVAAASVVDADDEEVAFAVGTITLFGVIAMIVYPLIGTVLSLSDLIFGTWSGIAINDTAQVVTAGFIYSETAGEIATLVKLTRNMFIAPVVFLFSIIYSIGQTRAGINYRKIFPWFVLGFIAMALLRTLDILPILLIEIIKEASSYLILMAIAGIGLSFNFNSIKNLGFKSLYIGLFGSTVMGLLSFLLINWLL